MSDVAIQPIRPEEPPAPATPRAPFGRPISRARRARKDRLFVTICIAATAMSVVVLIVLLASIFVQGVGRLSWHFITGNPSSDVNLAGMWPAIAGTAAISLVCAITAIPIGVLTAVLLEEFKPKHWLLRRAHATVQLNITNLAGVPSIVYGILGLTVFVYFFGFAMKAKPGEAPAPLFEVGVRYVDRFTTVDGYGVNVAVAHASDPPTQFNASLPSFDDNRKPTTANLLDAATVSEAVRGMQDRFYALQTGIEDKFETFRTLSGPALDTALAEQWTAAGLPGKPPAGMSGKLTQDFAQPGREAKKAMRATVKSFAAQAAASQFPRGIMSDATPSRIAIERPWSLRFPFGRSVLACGLTLMLVVLPIIIISTQEALRAVSDSLRRASLALGATKWQTIWNVTLPSALPGVMTGVILAMSRAIGEAAPILVVVGFVVYISSAPHSLMDQNTAMPFQIYYWAGLPNPEFHQLAAAGIILLLAVLLIFNLIAIWIRQRTQQKQH